MATPTLVLSLHPRLLQGPSRRPSDLLRPSFEPVLEEACPAGRVALLGNLAFGIASHRTVVAPDRYVEEPSSKVWRFLVEQLEKFSPSERASIRARLAERPDCANLYDDGPCPAGEGCLMTGPAEEAQVRKLLDIEGWVTCAE